MFWEDEDDKTLPFKAPETIFDVLFSIKCKSIPVDHAWVLSQEILNYLPWLNETDGAGIHQIHVAESNNGWLRPDDDNAMLFPSKRTKLSLRIPAEKFDEVKNLEGKTLNLNGQLIELGKIKKKLLGNSGVIFSRYVHFNKQQSENEFLNDVAEEIKQKTNIKIKKMLCGKRHIIKTPDKNLDTIHLMIADLDDETSVKIQQQGIGLYRDLGCGLFLPHKSIKTLKPTE